MRLIITSDGGGTIARGVVAGVPVRGGTVTQTKWKCGSRVIAVCCSTQGEGTIAVDVAGKALGNAVLWMDMRGAPYLHKQISGAINVAGADSSKVCASFD